MPTKITMLVNWRTSSLPNAERSHAGPTMPYTLRDGLAALADATG
ncbi:MAG: hypothetical protein ACLQU3_29305 [Limisphaerales bacterium]